MCTQYTCPRDVQAVQVSSLIRCAHTHFTVTHKNCYVLCCLNCVGNMLILFSNICILLLKECRLVSISKICGLLSDPGTCEVDGGCPTRVEGSAVQ
jgi:hypothetical protein